jgi:hypothetical protein
MMFWYETPGSQELIQERRSDMSVLGILVALAVTTFAVALKHIVEWLDARLDARDEIVQDRLLAGGRKHRREA